MATDAPWKRKLLEELTQSFFVCPLFRINLRIGTFQIYRREHSRRAMSRAGQENHVQVVLLDEPRQMDVAKGQARTRAPMAKQPVLDVLRPERFAQQRVLLEVKHPQDQKIARPPESICLAQLFGAQRRAGYGRASFPKSVQIERRMNLGQCGGRHRKPPDHHLEIQQTNLWW